MNESRPILPLSPELKEDIARAQSEEIVALEAAGPVSDLVAFLVNRGSSQEDAKAIVETIDDVWKRRSENKNLTPAQVITNALVSDQGGNADSRLEEELALSDGGGRVVIAEAGTSLGDAGARLAQTVATARVEALEATGQRLAKHEADSGFNLGDFKCVEQALNTPFESVPERELTAVVGGAVHRTAQRHKIDMSPKTAGALASVSVTATKAGYKVANGELTALEAFDIIERTSASAVEMLLVGGARVAAKAVATLTGIWALEPVIGEILVRHVAQPVSRAVGRGIRAIAEGARRLYYDVVKPGVVSVVNAAVTFVKELFA